MAEDKEFTEWTNGLKDKFFKILWKIFVFAKVPIIFVWVAFVLGYIFATIILK